MFSNVRFILANYANNVHSSFQLANFMWFLFVSANNILHSGVEMDSQQQQFCLKWNSFGSNLATSFSNLFKSETLADVTLFCDGKNIVKHIHYHTRYD